MTDLNGFAGQADRNDKLKKNCDIIPMTNLIMSNFLFDNHTHGYI